MGGEVGVHAAYGGLLEGGVGDARLPTGAAVAEAGGGWAVAGVAGVGIARTAPHFLCLQISFLFFLQFIFPPGL